MKKYKKGKLLLAAGGVCTVLVVVILAVFLYQPKEIDQKVLFIYRKLYNSQGIITMDEGYYIDNQGNKVDYDLIKILGNQAFDREEDKLLEILNTMEAAQSTAAFSQRETARLYRYLYRINAEQKIELEKTFAAGYYVLLGVRYKENGEAEIIKLLEAGNYYGENPDSYAQKIKTALVKKNPIWVH